MAASKTVFSQTPIAGINLAAVGSALTSSFLQIAALTPVFASDGHTYRMVFSGGSTIGSIDTVLIGTAGSAKKDAGSAGFTMNAPGGIVSGQYAWAKKTTL